MYYRALLVVTSLVLAHTVVLAQPAALQQDAEVVEALRKAGADFSKPHNVDYFFVMPNEAAAKSIAAALSAQELAVKKITRLPNRKGWEVLVQRSQLVQLEAMQTATATFTKLAEKFGGYYDGWGTLAVK